VTDPKFLIVDGTVASVSKKHLRAFEGLEAPIIRIERGNTSLCSHLRQPYRKSLNLNFKVPWRAIAMIDKMVSISIVFKQETVNNIL